MGTQRDLETKLSVRLDEGRGEDLTEGDSIRKVFGEPDVEGLESKLGPALMGGA